MSSLRLGLALVLSVAGCRNDAPTGQVDKPIPPSMQATIDAYAAPNAWLDGAGVVELAAAVSQRTTVIDSLAVDTRVIDAARAAIAQVSQQTAVAPQALRAGEVAVSRQALTVAGEGFLVVTIPRREPRLTPFPELVRLPGQMKSIAITEFKAQCLALLEDVSRTGEPLEITKRGKPLARVVPSGGGKAKYPQSSLSGTVTILDDVIAPVLSRRTWKATRGVLVARGRLKPKRS